MSVLVVAGLVLEPALEAEIYRKLELPEESVQI